MQKLQFCIELCNTNSIQPHPWSTLPYIGKL